MTAADSQVQAGGPGWGLSKGPVCIWEARGPGGGQRPKPEFREPKDTRRRQLPAQMDRRVAELAQSRAGLSEGRASGASP